MACLVVFFARRRRRRVYSQVELYTLSCRRRCLRSVFVGGTHKEKKPPTKQAYR